MEAATITPRMTNPIITLRGAYEGIMGLSKAVQRTPLPATTATMVHLRASQINGCSFCVDMHARQLREAGESAERIACVAAWRDAPFYDQAERVALELTEVVTRLADTSDPVDDELWARAAAQFGEEELGGLLVEIAAINVWNRVNVTIRQVAGAGT